jgi:hypothetical protein
MVDTDIERDYVISRIEQLTAEETAIESKLWWMRKFSHVAVVFGIVVPVLAGSTLASNGGLLEDLKIWIAVAVVLGGALTALHKGLDCEAYHAACMRSIHELRSLIESFQASVTLDADKRQATFAELESRLRRYRERARDVPPKLPAPIIDKLKR